MRSVECGCNCSACVYGALGWWGGWEGGGWCVGRWGNFSFFLFFFFFFVFCFSCGSVKCFIDLDFGFINGRTQCRLVVCVCVCVCECVYVCVCECVYVWMCVCVHTHICASVDVCPRLLVLKQQPAWILQLRCFCFLTLSSSVTAVCGSSARLTRCS